LALHDMGIVPPGLVGPEPQEPFVHHVEDPTGVAENGAGGGSRGGFGGWRVHWGKP